MKIMLVNSGNDASLGGNANDRSYPPLGIISLATALRRAHPDRIEVLLYDGQFDDISFLEAEVRRQRPDLVGISMYLTSIVNTLRLVREAKNVGAKTVLGNDHAIGHADTLMTGVPEIDFICLNDIGEETLVGLVDALLDGGEVGQIPLLAFRDGKSVRRSWGRSAFNPGLSLDRIEVPDRSLLPARYWQNYVAEFRRQRRMTWDSSDTKAVATINRARGCAQMASPCKYCGIYDLSIRYSSGRMFWDDARAARDQVDATVLYECFDSASSARPVLRKWLEARPGDLEDIRFKMYAQAFETNPNQVALFKALNVFCVNMGLDSGDDVVLRMLKGEKHSLEQNKRAAQMYTDAGIEIYTSFVLLGLGNPDNTRRSLDKTLEFAEWLASNTTTVSFDSALLYPDKNAPIGSWIWNPRGTASTMAAAGWGYIDQDELEKFSERYRSDIYLDPVEFSYDFARLCGVRPEILLAYNKEILNIAERAQMNFGRSIGNSVRELNGKEAAGSS